MQIKKPEIKQEILNVAEDQFLKHGYEQSSMRVIAKKANTTLGNIYHYFSNKEALLSALVIPTLEQIEFMLVDHIRLEKEAELINLEEISSYIDEMEITQFFPGMEALFDKKIVILLELKTSSLVARRDEALNHLKKHICWHLNLNEEEAPYSDILVKMITDCLKHALIDNDTLAGAKAEFIKLFRFFCMGITVQHK